MIFFTRPCHAYSVITSIRNLRVNSLLACNIFHMMNFFWHDFSQILVLFFWFLVKRGLRNINRAGAKGYLRGYQIF